MQQQKNKKTMQDKLEDFFLENKFDIHEPKQNHEARFERLINKNTPKKGVHWAWLSAAASIILLIGFWLGNSQQNQIYKLADVSPEMNEVETYFITTINNELKTIESNRSLETETIIEEALDQLEDLEDDYSFFVKELKKDINTTKVISAMIQNYQQRIQVLENVLQQIEMIKNPKLFTNEVI